MDTDNIWTPLAMTKNAQNTISKKKSDHRSISMNMTLLCILTNNKNRTVINFRNPEGSEKYKRVSEEHTQFCRIYKMVG